MDRSTIYSARLAILLVTAVKYAIEKEPQGGRMPELYVGKDWKWSLLPLEKLNVNLCTSVELHAGEKLEPRSGKNAFKVEQPQ